MNCVKQLLDSLFSAYILADQDYDVWLLNTRGNTYSRKHVSLNPDKDTKYWKFSWHELGIYDLPAAIDYILLETGHATLFYIGHSQGGTSFYVMTSEKPEYNKKIRAHFSLAPAVYMKHAPHPLFQLSGPFSALLTVSTKTVQCIYAQSLSLL